MKQRYAELYYPGLFMAESRSVKVKEKTTAAQLFGRHARGGCFRIRFFEREEAWKDGELLEGKPKWEPTSYIQGEAFTLAEMREMRPPLDEILVSNVEINRWKGAVRCLPGNWQPWEDSTIVVPPPAKRRKRA